MATNPIFLTQRMVTVTCCHAKCGICFAMPETFNEELRKNHESFFCPKGHSQSYPGKSDEEILRDKLKDAEWRLAEEKRSHDRTRGVREELRRKICRAKRRVARGRCPVIGCKAKFPDLKEHLRSHKHWQRRFPAVEVK